MFQELKDEIEETLNISDVTPTHIQPEVRRPRNIEAYKKLGSEKSSTDCLIILLMGYATSPFRDFESYPRIIVGPDENDIQMVSKQHN